MKNKYTFNIISNVGEIIMMYDINDLFLVTVNKDVTIISYSQLLDLINERKLSLKDVIENMIPLFCFVKNATYISKDDIQVLYDLINTRYFEVLAEGSKKMPIKQ